ncbi:hypothetical protein [Streptomyces sp. NBC_00525]|uniref:hypothetical protein n=1 Tax=Streptomyces sp. NBC_00525 TaxID=2903660 RepID=UPI002E812C64|nr:hypothetical protein [Streptomyces sp. NBC_00525]WUC97171.1 hypothetical protein OG710_27740 [Streptomyces sp. NBC_00525]
MALESSDGTIGSKSFIVSKSYPTPPPELLLETAVRAGLLISPLTTALGSADGLTAETAVDLVLSSSPVLPVLTDPDLAMVARVAETDQDQADELLAGITDMRKELVEQAARLGDARLSGQLTASAAAAVQFDAEAHTLPLPDDACVEAAINAVNQNVARVHGTLTTSAVRPEVIHRSMLRALRTSTPAVPVRRPSTGADPFIRRAVEAEALIRLSTGGGEAREAAVMLSGGFHWQDEALLQALEDEVLATSAPAASQPTKVFGGLSANQPAESPSVIVARAQQSYLGFSLGMSRWIGGACAQSLTAPTPPGPGSPAAPQRTVAAYQPLRPIGGLGGGFRGMGPSGDRVFDPELGEERELTDREKTIRDWGVGGFFAGWVGLGAVSTIGTAPIGGAGGLIGAPVGGIVGTFAGMKLGEWKYDHGWGGMFLRAGEVAEAVLNPYAALRYLLFGSQFD